MDFCSLCYHAIQALLLSVTDDAHESRYEGRLPRLDVKTFNNCWLCYGLAQWLQFSQQDQFERWCREPVQVKYRLPTIAKVRYPFYYLCEWLCGPQVLALVVVQLSSVRDVDLMEEDEDRVEDDDDDGWAVELCSVSSRSK